MKLISVHQYLYCHAQAFRADKYLILIGRWKSKFSIGEKIMTGLAWFTKENTELHLTLSHVKDDDVKKEITCSSDEDD